MANYFYDPEKKQTTGTGIDSLNDFLNRTDNKSYFKPKAKHWKPVLHERNIELLTLGFCKELHLKAIIYGWVELIKVPPHFAAEYEHNQTKLVYSHSMQRMVESFIPFNEYIIERCINEAIFFHPCEELIYTIDINS